MCVFAWMHTFSIFDSLSFSPSHPSSSLLSLHRSEFPMILVANKADLETDRVVSYQEGEELAKTLKVGEVHVYLIITFELEFYSVLIYIFFPSFVVLCVFPLCVYNNVCVFVYYKTLFYLPLPGNVNSKDTCVCVCVCVCVYSTYMYLCFWD